MDTATGSDERDEGGDIRPFSSDNEENAGFVAEFENLLHRCCLLPDDEQFWRRLEEGIHMIEMSMTQERLSRFEYSIDYILATHGLPAWSLVKATRK